MKAMEDVRKQIIRCKKCLGLGIDYSKEREVNLSYAYSYRPNRLKVLWVLESPPKSDPPRYFYRPELTKNDGLYREVLKNRGITPTNPKTKGLEQFQKLGHFLIDIAKCPVDKKNSPLREKMIVNCSDIFEREVRALKPEGILIVKSDVYKPTVKNLEEIGFADMILNKEKIPFPGSGHQSEFHELVSKYLGSC